MRDLSSDRGLPSQPTRSVPGVDQRRPFDPAELLRRVWAQSLPLIRERVAFLETAALQSFAGALSEPDRAEAISVSHKLAGALGMFGYPQGTEIARQLEILYTADDLPDPVTLAQLAAELRACLPL